MSFHVLDLRTAPQAMPCASPVALTTFTSSFEISVDASFPAQVVNTARSSKPTSPKKRKRVEGASNGAPKRPRTVRSRSTSATLSSSTPTRDTPKRAASLEHPFGSLEGPMPRPCWSGLDGDSQATSAEQVVQQLMHMYKSYFKNPEDPSDTTFNPNHPAGPPVVVLEYPNTGASERFLLLQPKDKDHYNPIFDLRCAVHTMIQYYCTPEQAALFGTHPSLLPLPQDHHAFSGFNQADDSADSSSSTPSWTPPPSSSPAPDSPPPPHGDLIKALNRAFLARDGPKFVQTVELISSVLRDLKRSGPDGSNPLAMAVRSWPGVHPRVYKVIIEQTYQRCVAPRMKDLRKYEAWTSNVYGELMPNFISDIVHITGLGPGKHFLDLGGGVGNVVLQAALQSGCSGAAVEIMPKCASIARTQAEQCVARCRMWGLCAGGDVEMIEGDFRHVDLSKQLARADVVLVNNFAFEAQLNDALSRLFLDLREDTIVVSLRPFVPANFRLTEHNAETPVAILRGEEREFPPGVVSWSVKGGTYYMYRIDRSMVRRFAEEQLQSVGTRSTRGSRRQPS